MSVASPTFARALSGRLSRMLPLLLTAFVLTSCGQPDSPVQILRAAQRAARGNHVDAFADYLSPASKAAFQLAESVGRRYGYLDEETFQFLALLEAGELSFHDDVAELVVTASERSGTLCFVQVDGEWKLELMRTSPCLAEAPDELAAMPGLWESAPATYGVAPAPKASSEGTP